jgi:glucose/arabinose dehydrogenase
MKQILGLLAAWLALSSLAFGAPAIRDGSLSVVEVTSGLTAPTTMAFIGAQDILVLQKGDGRVRRVIAGVLQPDPVLDVAVNSESERGLLGIAVHPNFPTSPFVYLYYTESTNGSDTSGSAEANRVYRYSWNGVTLTSPVLILDLPVSPGPNHNGGVITFGPDGKLYAVIGDLNRNGQLQNFLAGGAPDDTSVIFRINDDGSVPGDNPFAAAGGNLARYYAYGIRNSFGLAFDPVSDALWMTENGPGSYDEINLVEPGFNSGWEPLMGPDARSSNSASDLVMILGSHYADPKFSWLNTVAPTAIVFLDSVQLGAQYENNAFVGDINDGNLYRFRLNGARNGFVFNGAGLADLVADNSGQLDETIIATGFAGITDLKVGPDGRLYVVSFGDGKIYAISSGGSAALSISATSLPKAEVGAGYKANLNISGGVEPYVVSLSAGALPPGLLLAGGTISGTPTSGRQTRLTVRVVDSAGASVSKRFRLSILGALSITNQTLPAGSVGRRYTARLRSRGGQRPYAWSLVSGALPAGLTFDSASASIKGTGLAIGAADLTFQVTDPLGGVVQKMLTLTIR